MTNDVRYNNSNFNTSGFIIMRNNFRNINQQFPQLLIKLKMA